MAKTTVYNSTFWKIRSQNYNKLKWAKNHFYLNSFIEAGNFKKTDIVLDVGTGTGIVVHAISPLVKEVIGLDKSQDMLEHSNWFGNMYFIKRDILNPIFADEVFDKITCRQVFHHILKFRQKAMDECYRMLKKGGLMIFSEGIPPTKRVKKDYIKIFRLKEKRVTFYEKDLVNLMKKSSFKDIKVKTIYLKRMSVKNWLINSGLSKIIQEKIYRLHAEAADYFKQDYHMVQKERDCFIDMKMLILTGKK
ncbi:MAG: class I SAM-dependent methyltransferase [Candidatus Omnitrophica bacterium]|jgi:ubiquinone/menaquinone biosynthesis C-methylase UbiE|nr:class I SAM-dependent methyltransferase [Candidatus Omnitrophota bacterium]